MEGAGNRTGEESSGEEWQWRWEAENPSSKDKVRTRLEEQASKLTGEGHGEKRAAQYGGERRGAWR